MPTDIIPVNQDGEAIEHRRVSVAEAGRLIALDTGPDQVTPEASLVVLDALLRLGALDAHGEAAAVVTMLAAAP